MAIKHERGARFERRKRWRHRGHTGGGTPILRFLRAARPRLDRGELAAWAALVTGLILLAAARLAGV